MLAAVSFTSRCQDGWQVRRREQDRAQAERADWTVKANSAARVKPTHPHSFLELLSSQLHKASRGIVTGTTF